MAPGGELVQRRLFDERLRGHRRGRVVPRIPPQLAPLGGSETLALQDDGLDLLEGGAALDALAQGGANLLIHRNSLSQPVRRPLGKRGCTQAGWWSNPRGLAIVKERKFRLRPGTSRRAGAPRRPR